MIVIKIVDNAGLLGTMTVYVSDSVVVETVDVNVRGPDSGISVVPE